MEKQFFHLPKKSLKDQIPVPPRKPLPLEDVPMWSQLPYDTKYPLSECSKAAITLTTEDLGKSLYQTFPRKEFDLTLSPKPYLKTSPYNSLHDPHLRRFFLTPFRYKTLVSRGLVTEDGKVKSHVQEFNHYRMYLYHLWAMEVNQLQRSQMSEETNCFEAILRARKAEDSLFKKVAENFDKINVDEILEEAAMKIFRNKNIIVEHGFSPFVRAVIQWKIYQENLQKDYRNHYPEIKHWLCDKTKHYKRLMEMKLNAGRNRDKKLRSRWERICENSRARLEREMKLKQLEKEQRRILTQDRYNRVKRLWTENDRAIKLKKIKKLTDVSSLLTCTDPQKRITSVSESRSIIDDIQEPDITEQTDKGTSAYKAGKSEEIILTVHEDLGDDQASKRFSEEAISYEEKVCVTSQHIPEIDETDKELEDDKVTTRMDLKHEDESEVSKISDTKIRSEMALKGKEKILKESDISIKSEESMEKSLVYPTSEDLEREELDDDEVTTRMDLKLKDESEVSKMRNGVSFKEKILKESDIHSIKSEESVESSSIAHPTSEDQEREELDDDEVTTRMDLKLKDESEVSKMRNGVSFKEKEKILKESDIHSIKSEESVESSSIAHPTSEDQEREELDDDEVTTRMDLKLKDESEVSKMRNGVSFKEKEKILKESDIHSIKSEESVETSSIAHPTSEDQEREELDDDEVTTRMDLKLKDESEVSKMRNGVSFKEKILKESDIHSIKSEESVETSSIAHPTSEDQEREELDDDEVTTRMDLKLKDESEVSKMRNGVSFKEKEKILKESDIHIIKSEESVETSSIAHPTSEDQEREELDDDEVATRMDLKLKDESEVSKMRNGVSFKEKILKESDIHSIKSEESVETSSIAHPTSEDQEREELDDDEVTTRMDLELKDESEVSKMRNGVSFKEKEKILKESDIHSIKSEESVETSSIAHPSSEDEKCKELDDDKETASIDLELEDESQVSKISDTKMRNGVSLKVKEKILKESDMHSIKSEESVEVSSLLHPTSEVSDPEKCRPEISEKESVLVKTKDSKEEDEEPILPDYGKESEFKTDIVDTLLPDTKSKPLLDFMDHLELMKFLYGLPEVDKPTKTTLSDYSPVIEKADEISDEECARDSEITKKRDDSMSDSFKTPLEQILGGYGYEEHGDVWKALENLFQDKKKEYQSFLGLDENKIKQWRNEKIRKEFYEFHSSPSIWNENYSEAYTSDDSDEKTYRTDSESDLSEDGSKEDVIKRKFVKKQFDDIFIKNEYKRKSVIRKLGLPKIASEKKISSRLNFDHEVKVIAPKFGEYKSRREMLDVELSDLFITGRKPYFIKKEASKPKNLPDIKIKDFESNKKCIPQTIATNPDFTSSYFEDESYSQFPVKEKIADLPLPCPSESRLQKDPQTDYIIHPTISSDKEDSKAIEKHLLTLVDDIISEAEIPKIRASKTELDGTEETIDELSRKLESDIEYTDILETKTTDKKGTTFDSNDVIKPCTAITDTIGIKKSDEEKYKGLSKYTEDEDVCITLVDSKKDDARDEMTEDESAEESESLFTTVDINEKIIDDDVTKVDTSSIVNLQTEQEVDSILPLSVGRKKDSLSDIIQEMTDNYTVLQIPTTNETVDFLYPEVISHTTNKEKSDEFVKNIYGYPLAPEDFDYVHEVTFKNNLENILRQEIWEFIKTREKQLITTSDVETTDISDKSEDVVSLQPRNMISNIQSSRPEAKYQDIQDSHHAPKIENEKKLDFATTANIDKRQLPEFYQIQTEATSQAQPMQREMENAKVSYFDIQEKCPTLDTVTKFIFNDGYAQDEQEMISNSRIVKSVATPPLRNITIKNVDTSTENEEEVPEYKASKVIASMKRNPEVIHEIKAHETDFDYATHVPFNELCQSLIKSEIQLEPTKLPASDISSNVAETEVSTLSNYESLEEIKIHDISPSQFDCKFSLVSPKSFEIDFMKHSAGKMSEKYFEQARFTSDTIVDPTRTQIIPFDKDIDLHLETQFPKDDGNFDFRNLNSITANFNFSKPLANAKLHETNVRLFLNECISSIVEEFRQKKYSSFPQIESTLATDKNGSRITSETQSESSVLASNYRNTEKETKSENADEIIYIGESEPDSDHDVSGRESSSSSNRMSEIEIEHTFDESNEKSQVPTREVISSNENFFETEKLRDQGESLNVQNSKEIQTIDISPRQRHRSCRKKSGLLWEKLNPFKNWSGNKSDSFKKAECRSSKNTGIIITEDVQIFSEYATNNQYHDTPPLIEIEKQSPDSAESTASRQFDLNIKQDDNLEVGYKLPFDDPFDSTKANLNDFKGCSSNYIYAQKNWNEITNIASQKAEKLEQYFKTNKIRSTCTNVDEVVITDNSDVQIKVIEEKNV